MSTVEKRRLTPEEYLAIERKADFKSEFYRGEMFAMAGLRGGIILSRGISRSPWANNCADENVKPTPVICASA